LFKKQKDRTSEEKEIQLEWDVFRKKKRYTDSKWIKLGFLPKHAISVKYPEHKNRMTLLTEMKAVRTRGRNERKEVVVAKKKSELTLKKKQKLI